MRPADVPLIRFVFRDCGFVALRLFQKHVSYWALRQERRLMTCFSRAFSSLFNELLISLARLVESRHSFELFPAGRRRVTDLINRSQQLLARHIERAGPALQFVSLAYVDPRAVRLLPFGQLVHERLPESNGYQELLFPTLACLSQ